MISIEDVTIRNEIIPGDLGFLIYLHGMIYSRENGFKPVFETYVADGVSEFYKQYDPSRDRIWICEHDGRIIGSLVLMHREEKTAQLRYFVLKPEYRGIGLGKKLMNSFMDFFRQCNYTSCFLWTISALEPAAALYKKYGFVLTESRPSGAFGISVTEQRYDLTV